MEKHPILCKIVRPPGSFHTPDSVPMDFSDNICTVRIVCHRKTLTDRRQSMSWPPRNTWPSNRTSAHTLCHRCTRIRKLISLLCRLHFHPNQRTVHSLPHRLGCDLRLALKQFKFYNSFLFFFGNCVQKK